MDRSTLQRKSVNDLREIAKQLDLTGVGRLRKADLIDTIIDEVDDETDDGDDGGDGDPRDRDEVIKRRRNRNRDRDDADGSDDGDSDDADDADDSDGSDDDGNGDGGRPRARKRDRRKRSRSGRGDLDGLEEREGVLDLLPEGYGFLRTTGYVSGEKDVYVSQGYVRRFNLRRGDLLGGPVRYNKSNDKFPALARLETCEGEVVDNEHDPLLRDRGDFGDGTVTHPTVPLALGAGTDAPAVLQAIDLVAPIGRGQRALVLTPPATDHSALLRAMAVAIEDGSDDVDLFVALIDERPEEITAFEEVLEDAEVIGSPLDQPAEDHTAAAELVVERAKRLVERGHDVVVLLDSLSRLGRAYNLAGSSSGRSLPGGIDVDAIGPLKQLFGAARAVEGNGSLTIVATASFDSDSDTDRTILDHLRGSGNAELRLDPELGVHDELPAFDIQRSGTRRVEALLGEDDAELVWELRRALGALPGDEAWGLLVEQLGEGADAAAIRDAAREAAG